MNRACSSPNVDPVPNPVEAALLVVAVEPKSELVDCAGVDPNPNVGLAVEPKENPPVAAVDAGCDNELPKLNAMLLFIRARALVECG